MKRNLLILSQLPNFKFGNETICTYCGDKASGRDHVIPVRYQHLHDQSRGRSNGPITFACQRCNSKLGANWFDTFDERCRWMRDKIASIGLEVLWHKWELAKLDYNLQRSIQYTQNYRKWQRERADWYESRDYWLNIENLQWRLEERSASNPFLREYFGTTLRFLKEFLYERR